LNTDKNITGDERLHSYLTSVIENELSHFSDHMLEARLENRQPIAVTSHADTLEKAVNEALDKLKASLETIVGRLKHH
jgi:hypothetical protein